MSDPKQVVTRKWTQQMVDDCKERGRIMFEKVMALEKERKQKREASHRQIVTELISSNREILRAHCYECVDQPSCGLVKNDCPVRSFLAALDTVERTEVKL